MKVTCVTYQDNQPGGITSVIASLVPETSEESLFLKRLAEAYEIASKIEQKRHTELLRSGKSLKNDLPDTYFSTSLDHHDEGDGDERLEVNLGIMS